MEKNLSMLQVKSGHFANKRRTTRKKYAFIYDMENHLDPTNAEET